MSENGKTFGDLVGHQIVWDEMIQKYGLFSAVIYGRIWRRSQGEDGRCWESLPNIAEGLGISVDTVRRHLVPLIEAGEVFRQDRSGETSYLIPTRLLQRATPQEDDTPSRERGDPSQRARGTPSRERPKDTNKDKQQDTSVVVSTLEKIGIKSKVAQELSLMGKPERISKVVKHAQSAGYGSGWIVQAIREGWDLQERRQKRKGPPRGTETDTLEYRRSYLEGQL